MAADYGYQFGFALEDDSCSDGYRELMSGRMNHFVCDPRQWAEWLPGKLTPRLVDLLRIASAVYVADRISRRDRAHADSGWSRLLRMRIEVLDCEFWSSQEVRNSVRGCLEFLSGDQWEISFLPASSQFALGQLPFRSWKPLGENPVICLYSGGLDSAAGLVRHMLDHSSCNTVPLLVRHQGGQKRVVDKQIRAINSALKANLRPLILPFWMRSPKIIGGEEERTQRTRSFLFCSAAGVAATMIEARAIKMMEGGVGAINLPLMAGMVGSKATRNGHPTFLRRFSDLLQLVTGRELAVDLPHRLLTKAELTRTLVEAGLGDLALNTVSCVHYPLRDSGAKQCGTCPACIFRRQAIITAGIEEPDGIYQHDLFSNRSCNIPAKKLKYLRAFLMQIDKLGALDFSNQLPDFMMRHFRATEVISSDRAPSELVELYRRYRDEWLHLISRGQREGWEWTQMMGPVVASC